MSKIRKINTSHMRDDTWVRLKPLTAGEMQELFKMSQEMQAERLKEIRQEAHEINTNQGPASELLLKMLDDEYQALQSETSLQIGFEVFADRIVEWNWADDGGEVLPIPSSDNIIDILLELSTEEMQFLMDAMTGSSKEKKG
jgi:hypothetical protein